MNTNTKGTIGLLQVISKLTEEGFDVFLPISDHTRIDCVAVKNNITYKVQVKYRNVYRNSVEVPMNTVVNGKRNMYDIEGIDFFAVFCPDWGICFVPPKEGGYFLTEEKFKSFGEVPERPKGAVC